MPATATVNPDAIANVSDNAIANATANAIAIANATSDSNSANATTSLSRRDDLRPHVKSLQIVNYADLVAPFAVLAIIGGFETLFHILGNCMVHLP